MPRPFVPKIVTANDLLHGDVVYFTEQQTWSRNFSAAHVHFSQQLADQHLSKAEMQQAKIVGPYLAEIEASKDLPVAPAHFREKFRASGPSNYFHGKQAQTQSQGVA